MSKHLYKVVPREYSILIYDAADKEQYESSFQLQVNGTFGIIHSLNARAFYSFIRATGLSLFTDLGLTKVSIAVSRAHLRLFQRELSTFATVTVVGPETVAGKHLTRIELTDPAHPAVPPVPQMAKEFEA
jgi:hypothetical protein